jgi:hypothetical protein
MILHVLPGDATVETFKASGIEGDIAVCRECFVVGDVSGASLSEFWENRARYLATDRPGYQENVVREFTKLNAPGLDSEINLWFEYELFCQANMWFCLSLLEESTADIFRVAPVTLAEADTWDGFGNLTPDDFKKCFDARVKFSRSDIELGARLWSAFRTEDYATLERLSATESPVFPKLREACLAAIEKDSRPKQIVTEIIQNGEADFSVIFKEFRARAGEYGYGDSQVREIWQKLLV